MPRGGKMIGAERKKALAKEQQRLDTKALKSVEGILRRNPSFRNKYLSQWNTERSGKGVSVRFKRKK